MMGTMVFYFATRRSNADGERVNNTDGGRRVRLSPSPATLLRESVGPTQPRRATVDQNVRYFGGNQRHACLSGARPDATNSVTEDAPALVSTSARYTNDKRNDMTV